MGDVISNSTNNVTLYDENGNQLGTSTNPLFNSIKNGLVSGNLTAALTSSSGTPTAGTVVQLTVPDSHSSWGLQLSGIFSATSQVIFEGSYTGNDSDWFSLNGRRNADANTNDTSNLLDVNPFGGPSPLGSNPSYWRGSIGGVRYFRVRCGLYTNGDSISVTISTSSGLGTTFLNSPIPFTADSTVSASFTTSGQSTSIKTAGRGICGLSIAGTWVGLITFEFTIDGTNYYPLNLLQTSNSFIQTTNSNTTGRFNCGGYAFVRITGTTITSGTANVTLIVSSSNSLNSISDPINIKGLNLILSNRFSIGTTAIRVDSGLVNRKTVEIKASSNNTTFIFVGFSSNVNTSNGREVSPGEPWILELEPTSQIYCISSVSGQSIQCTEIG